MWLAKAECLGRRNQMAILTDGLLCLPPARVMQSLDHPSEQFYPHGMHNPFCVTVFGEAGAANQQL
jgi:hypothetical protein